MTVKDARLRRARGEGNRHQHVRPHRALRLEDRRSGDPGDDDVDPRHDDRQRRPRHPGARTSHDPGADPVGRHRLPAGARRGDPADRLGGAPLRRQARLPRLDLPLHGRLGPLRRRRVEHLADPLPRPPGHRRRHDHADLADDHGRGRRAETDGPRDGRRRHARDAGADPRPGRRWPDPAEPALVLDLLRQRADRDRRRDPRLADAARIRTSAKRASSTGSASRCWRPACR